MDIETRRKIARTMKGKSNFEGKRHTHATKIQIGISQEGHRNAKDHKWVTDKETGQEHRVKGNKPKGTRWGRTGAFSRWIHAKENFQDGRNPENKGDMARHGLKNKTMAQLKKVRSSDTATPRQKQLAHWYINMHKEEKEVWDKPNPVKNSKPLSSSMKARAKARAKAAGRAYPNMVDNIWAARNEDVPTDRLWGTRSLANKYKKDTPGQEKNVKEARAIASFRSSNKSNSMQAWLGAHKTCPGCKGQKPSGPFKIVKGVADNKPVCKDCQDDAADSN